MSYQNKFSIYLCYLLRHHPESIQLNMDIHGWVSVPELIRKINQAGQYTITEEQLLRLCTEDAKGRYQLRGEGDNAEISACQGHSIPWVQLELQAAEPPAQLYHGTTMQNWKKILHYGAICRMERHDVHLTADPAAAWKAAKRWKKNPVILAINSGAMANAGIKFAVSKNGVWCTHQVPGCYITHVFTDPPLHHMPSGSFSPEHPIP